MWIDVAPIWITSPPAMITAGTSTRPLGTMPVKARLHDESAAANPSRNPGANVSRNPLSPAVVTARMATRMKARTLWLKSAAASKSGPPSPVDLTRLDSTGFTPVPGPPARPGQPGFHAGGGKGFGEAGELAGSRAKWKAGGRDPQRHPPHP